MVARDLAEQRRTGLTAEQLDHLRWMAQGTVLGMATARMGRRLSAEERTLAVGAMLADDIEDVVALLTYEQRQAILSWGWPYPK